VAALYQLGVLRLPGRLDASEPMFRATIRAAEGKGDRALPFVAMSLGSSA